MEKKKVLDRNVAAADKQIIKVMEPQRNEVPSSALIFYSLSMLQFDNACAHILLIYNAF